MLLIAASVREARRLVSRKDGRKAFLRIARRTTVIITSHGLE
jgi:hypothetical protein